MENIFNTYFDFIIDLYLFCYIYYINFNRINKIKNINWMSGEDEKCSL